MTEYETHSVSMPKALSEVVDQLAEEQDVSRSKIHQQAIYLARIFFSEEYTFETFFSETVLKTPMSHLMQNLVEASEEMDIVEDEIPDIFKDNNGV